MVFSTHIFLFYFLPVVLLGYYAVRRKGPRTLWLTAMSYVFYGWERPDFCILIGASTVLDYLTGSWVAVKDRPGRKVALILSILGNLGLLAYFKYANFAMESLNGALGALGSEELAWARVALPVGISFYTFQTMSYTIDIYRGEARPAPSFAAMACYVALFPQLVAGPIVRYRTLAEQLRDRVHTLEGFGQGAFRFMLGFSKKILLANSAGQIADVAFRLEEPGCAAAWVGIIAYALQIYFDFSGYSDMAIGLGRMFGFVFPENFDAPYRSCSITEFWRRWHISLSTWLRDYLYIPLGGNRKGSKRTYIHLILTMLLGGLWHGAEWTFVAWGAYHGTLLAIERGGKELGWTLPLPRAARMFLTFILVLIGWVFFRADSFDRAWIHLTAMANPWTWSQGFRSIAILDAVVFSLTGLAFLLTWVSPTSQRLAARMHPCVAFGTLIAFLLSIGQMFFQEYNPFLYFRF